MKPLLLSLALGAAACQVDPPRDQWPEITYRHLPPLRFDVAEVVVEQSYLGSLEPPHVEHLMPLSPAALAQSWARDRLTAAGQAGRLIYRVREASVIETELGGGSGGSDLDDLFRVSQSERYDARLLVEIMLVEPGGRTRARVEAEAVRSITVPEDASLREREAIWFTLVEALMRDLNAELEGALYQYMAPYILSP